LFSQGDGTTPHRSTTISIGNMTEPSSIEQANESNDLTRGRFTFTYDTKPDPVAVMEAELHVPDEGVYLVTRVMPLPTTILIGAPLPA